MTFKGAVGTRMICKTLGSPTMLSITRGPRDSIYFPEKGLEDPYFIQKWNIKLLMICKTRDPTNHYDFTK